MTRKQVITKLRKEVDKICPSLKKDRKELCSKGNEILRRSRKLNKEASKLQKQIRKWKNEK